MSDSIFKKENLFEIFVGLKDKDSYEELFTVEDFKNILSEICIENQISFSLLTQLGGYTHNKGYTTETSLRIIIIGITEEEATMLGKKLKERVNTDTILTTKSEIECCYI